MYTRASLAWSGMEVSGQREGIMDINNGAVIRIIAKWLLPCLLFAAGGCSTLPSGSHVIISPWRSYDDVKTSYDKIELDKTTKEELKALYFDPFTRPNIAICSHLDIMQRFLVNTSIKIEDLDEGLQKCIKAKTRCKAYLVDINNTSYERYGNFFTDLLTFSRKTKQVGWKFSAMIVLVDNVVVYKSYGGTPIVDIDDRAVKPLGPAQGIGEQIPTVIP